MSERSEEAGDLGEIRRRRMERAENARSALDRQLEPYYATRGRMFVEIEGGPSLAECCDVAAFRLPGDQAGEYIALLGSAHADTGSVALKLRRDDLRALLALVEGEEVPPDAVEPLHVGVMDLCELEDEDDE